MARLMCLEVFNSVINAGTTYYSSTKFNEILGRADSFTTQYIIDSVQTATTTVTVTYQYSNDPSSDGTWKDMAVLKNRTVATALTTDPPISEIYSSGTEVNGAQGRFKITSSTDQVAFRIVVCLRATA